MKNLRSDGLPSSGRRRRRFSVSTWPKVSVLRALLYRHWSEFLAAPKRRPSAYDAVLILRPWRSRRLARAARARGAEMVARGGNVTHTLRALVKDMCVSQSSPLVACNGQPLADILAAIIHILFCRRSSRADMFRISFRVGVRTCVRSRPRNMEVCFQQSHA